VYANELQPLPEPAGMTLLVPTAGGLLLARRRR